MLFTYKAYILSRIKRAILFDKSKIALKSKVKYVDCNFLIMRKTRDLIHCFAGFSRSIHVCIEELNLLFLPNKTLACNLVMDQMPVFRNSIEEK